MYYFKVIRDIEIRMPEEKAIPGALEMVRFTSVAKGELLELLRKGGLNEGDHEDDGGELCS